MNPVTIIENIAIKGLAYIVDSPMVDKNKRTRALLSLSKIDPKRLKGIVRGRTIRKAKALKELLGKFSLKELRNRGPLGYREARQKLANAKDCRQEKDKFLGFLNACDDRVDFMDVHVVSKLEARYRQYSRLMGQLGYKFGQYIGGWSYSFSTKGAMLASGLL